MVAFGVLAFTASFNFDLCIVKDCCLGLFVWICLICYLIVLLCCSVFCCLICFICIGAYYIWVWVLWLNAGYYRG